MRRHCRAVRVQTRGSASKRVKLGQSKRREEGTPRMTSSWPPPTAKLTSLTTPVRVASSLCRHQHQRPSADALDARGREAHLPRVVQRGSSGRGSIATARWHGSAWRSARLAALPSGPTPNLPPACTLSTYRRPRALRTSPPRVLALGLGAFSPLALGSLARTSTGKTHFRRARLPSAARLNHLDLSIPHLAAPASRLRPGSLQGRGRLGRRCQDRVQARQRHLDLFTARHLSMPSCGAIPQMLRI